MSAAHQIIRTDGSEDLVVLTRAQYDALQAAAGDSNAEVRAASRIVADSDAAIAGGSEMLLPGWLALPIARGEAPAKVVREQSGRSRSDIATAAGIKESHLSDIECGNKAPSPRIRARLAAALGIDPTWLVAVPAR